MKSDGLMLGNLVREKIVRGYLRIRPFGFCEWWKFVRSMVCLVGIRIAGIVDFRTG